MWSSISSEFSEMEGSFYWPVVSWAEWELQCVWQHASWWLPHHYLKPTFGRGRKRVRRVFAQWICSHFNLCWCLHRLHAALMDVAATWSFYASSLCYLTMCEHEVDAQLKRHWINILQLGTLCFQCTHFLFHKISVFNEWIIKYFSYTE